ncbi:hypothetical protein HMPREF0971_01997 [Segatella oris F0302]|uniref:Phage tail tape measure protein, TP901 family n=1 Tax=Segatella oris F0302 TaxID=649760 RepID=D1QSN6_9BACT|nr:hypothetical protein [Segatella oris]EFB31717.1 hypothetical protein HMPREF0971_01997 [Segatella oris F0302]
MANKHLSEDEIQYTVDVKTAKAQQEIHKLEIQSASLRNENKQRLQQMVKLEASGKKETDLYKKLAASYKDTGKQIRDLTSRIQEQTRSLDTNAMTMSQLRKQSKSLQKELDNTSQSLNPKQYEILESRLKTVNARMAELKQNAKNFKELASSDEYNNFFLGQLAVKGIETFVGWGKSLLNTLSDTVDKSIELAESADGITHAFAKIGTTDYLQKLRTATKGTVSDIELMKAAVKAKDFRIPLEDLGKYLSFAQLKAQQTGQSLDYMVDSIVTGLGRKSPMILDNLGLSAAEIKEQTAKTGDFMKGVAKIVENNLAQAGETYISAADRAAQRTVALENAQRSLGEALLPIKEEFSDVYGQIQIGAIKSIKYLIEHRDTLVLLTKAVVLLTATYAAYVAGQKLSYLWSLRAIAVSKLKTAAAAVENAMLQLSVLRHAVLNKTMTTSIALQKAFNIVLKLSPWGLILGGITLVVGALLMFSKRTDAAAKAQKMFNDVKKEAISNATAEKSKIELLTAAARDEKLSLDDRRKAINELNKIIPNYNGQLDETTGKYRENKQALDDYITSLVRKYEIEGAKKMFEQLGDAASQAKFKLSEAKKAYDAAAKGGAGYTYTTSWGAVGNTTSDLLNQRGIELSKAKTELADIEKQRKSLLEVFGEDLKQDAVANINNSNHSLGTVGAMLDQIEKKINALKAKRLTVKVGDTKDLKAIDSQIAQLEKRKEQLEYKTVGSTKGKGNKTADPDTTAAKSFNHDRTTDLDAAKLAYNQDLNVLRQALAEKRLTQEQYNASQSALNIQHQNNLLTIEQTYLQRSQTLQIKDAEKRKQLQEQQAKAVTNQQQAVNNAYLDAEKLFYDTLSRMKSTAPAAPQTLQQECDAKLLVLDGYYQASLKLAKEDAQRQQQVTADYEAAKAAIIADYAKKAEDEKTHAKQEYGLDTFEEQYAARRKKIEKDILLNEQERQQALTNLDQQAEEHRLQIRQQYGLATQQELYNAELEQLKMHLQNKEISQQEYEEAVKNLKIAKAKEAFDYYANLTSGAMQALMQAEEANVDAKYDAEIEAAKNAGKDTTELEKKKANEKLKIQKKYADVNFAIQASQIIASTAAAIAKTFSELGFPAGIPAAALMAVTGTAQLAAALAERNKVKKMTMQGTAANSSSGARVATGLESGGSIDIEREQDGKRFHAAYEPNRRGFVDKPTVIVGEGGYGQSKEWVASNAAVENPTISPIIDIIDRAQRAGTIRTLDMNKFLLQQASGRAAGGTLTSHTPSALSNTAYADPQKDELIRRLTTVLDRLVSEGIPASVAIDEIEQKQQLRDKARRFGSKA